LGLILVN